MKENYTEIKKMEAEETDNVKNCCPSQKHTIISECMFYIQHFLFFLSLKQYKAQDA
jgi:hypothetical protein